VCVCGGGPSMVTCGNLVGSEDQLFSCATTQGASNARLFSWKISGWPVVKYGIPLLNNMEYKYNTGPMDSSWIFWKKTHC